MQPHQNHPQQPWSTTMGLFALCFYVLSAFVKALHYFYPLAIQRLMRSSALIRVLGMSRPFPIEINEGAVFFILPIAVVPTTPLIRPRQGPVFQQCTNCVYPRRSVRLNQTC